MPSHRDRRATRQRSEGVPPRSGRPKDDDDRSSRSESALGSDAKAREAYKSLGSAQRLARKLVDILDENHLPATISIDPYYARSGGGPSAWPAILAALKALPDVLNQEQARLRQLGLDAHALLNIPVSGPDTDPEWVETYRASTPQNVLFRQLAEAYREFFEEEPKIRQSGHEEPGGPFVAFVIAAHAMQGRVIEPEAVKAAFRRAGQSLSE